MLKFENNSVYVLDNVTDEVIFESDNENVVKAIKNILSHENLAMAYYESMVELRAEKDYYEAKKCERYFTENQSLARHSLEMFNLLMGTDIKTYHIFVL